MQGYWVLGDDSVVKNMLANSIDDRSSKHLVWCDVEHVLKSETTSNQHTKQC